VNKVCAEQHVRKYYVAIKPSGIQFRIQLLREYEVSNAKGHWYTMSDL
jgi:hypothetical protein